MPNYLRFFGTITKHKNSKTKRKDNMQTDKILWLSKIFQKTTIFFQK